MKALIDRHHGDLFYSLQLLFEDRLGIEVYTPVAHEWWDEGYWRFGQNWGDDRLAGQFLVTPFLERDDEHRVFDPAHPERPIRTVTLSEAREMDWAFVVATVDDNQHGFHRFAKEMGAEYVLQVGNTGQQIDWRLDPLALVSSEMPIHGRGVVYHQEFDSDGAFRYAGPPSPMFARSIWSFVNLMPAIDCGPLMAEYAAELGRWAHGQGFIVKQFGINTPGGVIQPVQKIADLMFDSGFGWHDKVTGDGFGHVIHNWAAIGRPLIGHAYHYAGKMAEPFWTPETSIDLGARSFDENVKLIRDISADPDRHAEMCRAIRAKFDELVDYATEADAIASLLGIKVAVPA